MPELAGYTMLQWRETCGKGCSSDGVTCVKRPMTLNKCKKICDDTKECIAFQAPSDDGFHNWCVWFDYVPLGAGHGGCAAKAYDHMAYIKGKECKKGKK